VSSPNQPASQDKPRYWGSRIHIRVNRRFLDFCSTLHVYLTMFGMLVMFLFGLTGFTINHEDWFGATSPHVIETETTIPAELLAKNDNLRLVEQLRSSLHIAGAMTAFDDLDDRFSIGFKEPGQIWEIEVEKTTGVTKVHHETFNFTAIINNLHRGRYSGETWRWVIDISAILIVVACATGIVLWLALPRRRVLGAVALALGILGTLFIYWVLVPGRDVRLNPPASLENTTSPTSASESR